MQDFGRYTVLSANSRQPALRGFTHNGGDHCGPTVLHYHCATLNGNGTMGLLACHVNISYVILSSVVVWPFIVLSLPLFSIRTIPTWWWAILPAAPFFLNVLALFIIFMYERLITTIA